VGRPAALAPGEIWSVELAGRRELGPGAVLPGMRDEAQDSSRGFGLTKKQAGTRPIRNRTDTVASSPDRTANALTGYVALSVSPLLVQESYCKIYLIVVLLFSFVFPPLPSHALGIPHYLSLFLVKGQ